MEDNYSKWYNIATGQGADADMVFDILKDWRKEREYLLKAVNIFASGLGFKGYKTVEDCLVE